MLTKSLLERDLERNARIGRAVIDLTGQRFGRLVALRLADNARRNRQARWVVQCDCGTVKEVNSQSLRAHKIKSCGCLRIELAEAARRRREIAEAAVREAEASGVIPPLDTAPTHP